jgi:23S rRNA (guanosine2251-2'-O)-methyltransferase
MAAGAVKEALYGRNPVREVLRAGRRTFRRLLLAEGVRRNPQVEEVVALARRRGCPVETGSRDDLSRLARSHEHQGMVLESGPYPYAAFEEIVGAAQESGPAALVLLLDRLQDPQNLGTLLRTAEAVGVQGVLLPEHRAAAVTPAVVKASAGAAEHLSIAQVTNLARALQDLQEAGLWVMGLEEDPQAVLYTAVDWNRPLAVVVGSEGFGLQRLVRERCDGLVRLPMQGRVGSLNAAVAGSVILYEIWRCRGGFPARPRSGEPPQDGG